MVFLTVDTLPLFVEKSHFPLASMSLLRSCNSSFKSQISNEIKRVTCDLISSANFSSKIGMRREPNVLSSTDKDCKPRMMTSTCPRNPSNLSTSLLHLKSRQASEISNSPCLSPNCFSKSPHAVS